MSWIRLNHHLNGKTPGYGGQLGFEVTTLKDMSKGDSSNSFYFSMNNHLGTHIDFPKHFLLNGKSLSDYSPESFIFRTIACVEVFKKTNEIVKAIDLPSSISRDIDILLIKTGFEQHREEKVYWEQNPGFEPDLGHFLKQNYPKLRAIGIDSISLSGFQHRELGREAHRVFLGNQDGPPIWIIEDMSLQQINDQTRIEQVVVAPLPIEFADGAPCSVLAQVKE